MKRSHSLSIRWYSFLGSASHDLVLRLQPDLAITFTDTFTVVFTEGSFGAAGFTMLVAFAGFFPGAALPVVLEGFVFGLAEPVELVFLPPD